jgi:hypothetical protein
VQSRDHARWAEEPIEVEIISEELAGKSRRSSPATSRLSLIPLITSKWFHTIHTKETRER